MPSTVGHTLKVTVFGQSHSPAIGCVIEGLPAGVAIDQQALQAFLDRRAPGTTPWSTPRKEADRARIVAGLNPQGVTCGSALAAVIENTNTRSKDYTQLERIPRPGHADFAAWAKWGDARDVPGGGQFSGRLTAPLCVAGGIALQVLAMRDVRVAAHILRAAGVTDEPLQTVDVTPAGRRALAAQMDALGDGRRFPTLSAPAGQRMVERIMGARDEGDSVGGVVECAATGLPAGIGSPMFDGIENLLARALFGIPAVKGVEFGDGFGVAELRGSQDNDPYGVEGGAIAPRTNHAGGILGGITTGAPIVARAAFKPTPSISIEQDSVDLSTGQPAKLTVSGRHDPCVVPRAVPVVEAVCAIALLDAWLSWPPETFTKRAF